MNGSPLDPVVTYVLKRFQISIHYCTYVSEELQVSDFVGSFALVIYITLYSEMVHSEMGKGLEPAVLYNITIMTSDKLHLIC